MLGGYWANDDAHGVVQEGGLGDNGGDNGGDDG